MKYIPILITLCLLSCSNKIVEDKLYITKKYHGKVISCDTLVKKKFALEGSMLVVTDSCMFILRGNHLIQPGLRTYVHHKPEYRRDNSPLATIGNKQYKLK